MPFTEEEIALMRKIGVDLDFEHFEDISDDEWIALEEAIADQYVLCELHEANGDYYATSDGEICEDILEKLARMD